MDYDIPIDLAEIHKVIDTAGVLIVRFSTLEKRFLIDNRYSPLEGPIVRVVNRARSMEERFQELRAMRPRFPLPEEIMTFFWPKHVASLERLGILERIIARFISMGYPEMEDRCKEAYHQLIQEEHQELIAAIKGQGYESLWERKS